MLDCELRPGQQNCRKGTPEFLRNTMRMVSEKDALPDIDQIFRITERTIDRNGNLLLFPDIEVELYWSNLDETPEKVIELYHGHATSEQFHSKLKSDMDVERLPSGKFKVNSVILHLAMIAFNTLRKTGRSAMGYPEDLPYQHTGSRRPKRKRLRKVMDDLMRISCRLVYHARRWIMKFYIGDPWYPVFRKIYEGFG